MNIDELEEIVTANALDPLGEDEDDEFSGLSEEELNLNEALALLESCGTLFLALADPVLNPKGKISKYFKKEVKRVGGEVVDLLLQYGIGVEDSTEGE